MHILIEKPNLKVLGTTFWPVIWIKDKNDILTLSHEKIHIRQAEELLVILLPVLYGIFWVVYRLKGYRGYELYRRNPISMDAWHYEGKFKERPWYGWRLFIFIDYDRFLHKQK